jgi:hypothetical protein
MVLVALSASVVLGCLGLIARGASFLHTEPKPAAPGRAPAARRLPAPPAAPSPLQIGEQVLSRNIFDSAGGGQPWEIAPPPGEQDAGVSDGGTVLSDERCSGDLRLLASIVRERDPERSLAALRKDGKTEIVTVGERLGDLELVAVYPTGAYFRLGSGASCNLPVYLSEHAAPLPPLPPPVVSEAPPAEKKLSEAEELARKKRPPAFSEEELKKNIRMLGPARYAVTRELFTRARMNPSGISRGARFKPQTKEGRASGMQVSRLRDDSLLAHLGVKQGDVLRGINGFSLGSADGVLEAFGHLGKKSEVTLSLERDGALTTIQYVLE